MPTRSWVNVAALVLLAIALLGVYQYEAAQGGGSAFLVRYPATDAPGPSSQGDAVEGRTEAIALHVAAPNLTRVVLALAWEDDIGAPDTFNLTVTSPAGETRSEEGSSGALSVAFDRLADAPEQQRVLAASAEEAAARAQRSGASDAGAGAWNATITLVRAPGVLVGGVEVQRDGENPWRLSSTLTSYHAEVGR